MLCLGIFGTFGVQFHFFVLAKSGITHLPLSAVRVYESDSRNDHYPLPVTAVSKVPALFPYRARASRQRDIPEKRREYRQTARTWRRDPNEGSHRLDLIEPLLCTPELPPNSGSSSPAPFPSRSDFQRFPVEVP